MANPRPHNSQTDSLSLLCEVKGQRSHWVPTPQHSTPTRYAVNWWNLVAQGNFLLLTNFTCIASIGAAHQCNIACYVRRGPSEIRSSNCPHQSKIKDLIWCLGEPSHLSAVHVWCWLKLNCALLCCEWGGGSAWPLTFRHAPSIGSPVQSVSPSQVWLWCHRWVDFRWSVKISWRMGLQDGVLWVCSGCYTPAAEWEWLCLSCGLQGHLCSSC